MGPKGGLDASVPTVNRTLHRPAHSPVTIQATLSQLQR
jgi:hypothetical protein